MFVWNHFIRVALVDDTNLSFKLISDFFCVFGDKSVEKAVVFAEKILFPALDSAHTLEFLTNRFVIEAYLYSDVCRRQVEALICDLAKNDYIKPVFAEELGK
jgi:hypothetical protein